MTQKSILITGCSSGIGLDAARRLKSKGWRVIATARKAEDIAWLTESERFETLQLELTDPASISKCAISALKLTEGRIDAIYNNAAYGQVGAVEDLTPDLLRRQIEVNVIGTHDLTRRIIPSMRKNGWGRIVQCSSVLGFIAGPYRGAYCASKYALEGLTDAMRLELAGTGIKVSLIEPGPIRTRFVEHALKNFRETIDFEASPHREQYRARLAAMEAGGSSRFKLEPEAVTAKLIHALESSNPKQRYFVTTATYIAAAGKRFLPAALADKLLARL